MSRDANRSREDTAVLFLHINVIFLCNDPSPTFQPMISLGRCLQLCLRSTLQVNVTIDPTVAFTSSGCSVMLNFKLFPEEVNCYLNNFSIL